MSYLAGEFGPADVAAAALLRCVRIVGRHGPERIALLDALSFSDLQDDRPCRRKPPALALVRASYQSFRSPPGPCTSPDGTRSISCPS